MTHVDENGAVRTKTELLAGLKPLPKGRVGRLQITHFQVKFEGPLAISFQPAGVLIQVSVERQRRRTRHPLDARERTGGRCQSAG